MSEGYKPTFEGVVDEIKSMLDEAVNPITETIEIEDESVEKMDGQVKLETEKATCDCATCKEKGTSCNDCTDCMSKSYESDNEDEDKWDNVQKACWAGYKQVGMKDKNGKQVPNCVPVEKVEKSIWAGTFLK